MGRRRAPKGCYWRGPVLWGRAQVAGREYRWSLRTSDVAIAKRRRQAEGERLIAARHFGEQRHKYEDVFVEWSEHIATQVSATTATRYAASLKGMEPELLPLFIDEIAKATVLAIVKRRRAIVSMATVRRDLTALSSVLTFAEDQDYREGNPALDRLRKLKERRDPIVLPEHAHIARVLARASAVESALIRTALAAGCRQAELVYAERRNLDLARKQLTVVGKGNKLRAIGLDDGICEMLRALPARIGCRWLFWQDVKSRSGRQEAQPLRWIANRFRNLVKAAMKAAQKSAQENGHDKPDFRRFTFHHLRHRHAVDWLKAGKSIYDLQHRLGHTSIKTTEDHYLKFLTIEEERAVKAARSL